MCVYFEFLSDNVVNIFCLLILRAILDVYLGNGEKLVVGQFCK